MSERKFRVVIDDAAADALGVDAAYVARPSNQTGPGTFVLRSDASRGEVLEELYHSYQHLEAGFPGENTWGQTRIAREMETQIVMHNFAAREGWTLEEQRGFFPEAWTFWQGRGR